MTGRFVSFAILAADAVFSAAADVPDLTADMEALCNPNATRWTASQPLARAATSLGVCDGKLFVSGGDWDDNLGPCPIFSVDPYTGAYVKEFESGTESIDYFRTDSEGCLYAPSVDPREGHANECNVARRNADGTWTALKIAPNRWMPYSSSENAYYGTHTWDVAFWKGKIFTAGYGIGVGPEKTTARLSDATPQITHCMLSYPDGLTVPRRFYAFLPFEDDIFCYPLNRSGTGFDFGKYTVPIGQYGYEEWRFDESTEKFVCTTNAFTNVTPDLASSDLAFVYAGNTGIRIQLWHPTAFNGRVLYIAGIPEMTTVPFALYTAQNVNHSVKATRVNLGSGVFPFDIFVHDGVATVLAAQYDSTAKKAVNSVWESTDGVSFTKKFTFSGVQYANAIAWCDGAYFVAMGAREAVKNAWTFTGTDEVGKIYRIRDPAFADAIQVVAENDSVSVGEGGTAVARFKLAAQPAASVTAAVRVSGGVPAVSTDVASVTFTPNDWNQWHEVPLAAAEDETEEIVPSRLVCGAGDPAALRAASVTVTPVNNDIFVPLTTADSGAVATNSATHAQYGANGAFDDNRSDTNGRWLATKSDHMFVVWKFNEATAVNMLRVWNGSDSAGGYASASRAPKAWTFSGSNDGENWTALDTRSNETGWSASGESRMYSFGNDTAYLYYKFDCTALNGATDYLQLWELEFYYVESGSSDGGGDEPGGDEPGGGSGGEGTGGTTEDPVVPNDGIVLYDRLMICGTNNTQGSGVHILTDYVPKSNSVVRAKYASDSAASSSNNQFLFCSRKGSDNNKEEMKHFSFAPNVGGKFRFDYYDKQHGASATFTAGADYELEVKDGYATVTNVASGGTATRLGSGLKSFETTYRLALFQSYLINASGVPASWSNSFRGTFYYLEIYELEGGVEVLKHHFVPCTSNGVAAVCDIADARRVYVPVETSGYATVEGATALAADVPEPVFGGAGVSAPSFGTDAAGAQEFSFAIGNAVKGARYQVYRAASLSEKFEPWGEIVTAWADGVLDFAVATEGAPSGFFVVEPVR